MVPFLGGAASQMVSVVRASLQPLKEGELVPPPRPPPHLYDIPLVFLESPIHWVTLGHPPYSASQLTDN